MALVTDRPATPATPAIRSRARRSRLRKAIYVLLVLIVLVAVGLGYEGWRYSSQLIEVSPSRPNYTLQVYAVHAHTIRLASTDSTRRPGTYGIDWPGGRATIGTIISSDAKTVVRRVTGGSLRGLKPGMRVDLDVAVYGSPAPFHLAYRTVTVPGPLGWMPAWYIPGKLHTWAILVHGHKANRKDPLRAVPTLAHLGLPVLDMTYRNDIGAPSSGDHLYHLGDTEWRDLQAGVRYALSHGARNVILYGFSMGGNIVVSFLHHSSYAGKVRASVLDAPALNWAAVIDWHAEQSSLPRIFTWVEAPIIKEVVALRLGTWSLDAVNQVQNLSDLKTPILLFHGTADTNVPIGPSRELAHERPDIVTFYAVKGAEHTQEWNIKSSLYNARLEAFLTRVLG
jgi:dienelactone hydrolase